MWERGERFAPAYKVSFRAHGDDTTHMFRGQSYRKINFIVSLFEFRKSKVLARLCLFLSFITSMLGDQDTINEIVEIKTVKVKKKIANAVENEMLEPLLCWAISV